MRMIIKENGHHYVVPDDVVKVIKKFEQIRTILKERSPYSRNRETCDMIRRIVEGDEE